MFRSVIQRKNVRQIAGLVAAITIASMAGLGLWADIPGPKPDRDVYVESFSPQGGTDPAVNLAIKFSNSLVSPDSLNLPTTINPIKIEPEIEGLARWTASDQLMIYLSQPLDPATTYKVTVKAGGGYTNGNVIAKAQEFSFRTPALTTTVVRYHAQRSRDQKHKARLIVDLNFNYPVNRELLKERLRIEGRQDFSKSKLAVIWPDTTYEGKATPLESRRFRLVTELFDLRNKEQLYQLKIDKDFTCLNCGDGLSVDYTYTMKVPTNPKLNLRVEAVRAERAGDQGLIMVQFSARVPVEEVREYVSIEPVIPFTVESYWRGVRLHGNFSARSTYTVKVAPGALSTNGELMEREYSGIVIMGDLRPSVRFTSPGLYLPRDGKQLLEINSVNIDTLSIEVSQIFPNNLVPYMASGSHQWGRTNDAFGRRTFVMDFPLASEKNKELTSTIDLKKILGDSLKGVFIVSARSKTSRWLSDSRQVMVTDIGVTARMSDRHLLVWANSLSKTESIRKGKVRLYSKNNQLLVEGQTNSKGVAQFSDIADQVEGFDPFLITVEKDGDLAYLRLDNTRLPVSDFDVSGRPFLTDGYEAFVYLDRGVFRPGETAHLVSLYVVKMARLRHHFHIC